MICYNISENFQIFSRPNIFPSEFQPGSKIFPSVLKFSKCPLFVLKIGLKSKNFVSVFTFYPETEPFLSKYFVFMNHVGEFFSQILHNILNVFPCKKASPKVFRVKLQNWSETFSSDFFSSEAFRRSMHPRLHYRTWHSSFFEKARACKKCQMNNRSSQEIQTHTQKN